MSTAFAEGEIRVTQHVWLRDDSGRFLAAVEQGAHDAAWELADTVAALGIAGAPVRTGFLVSSIRAYMVGATEGVAVATAPYADVQEKGGAPHSIGEPGQPLFNPEQGFAAIGPVNHPGNPATHFLTNAGHAVAAMSAGIVARHMPR